MSVQIFDNDCYRDFLIAYRENTTDKRSFYSKLSLALDISPSLISQVIKKDKSFSFEQGIKVSEFLSLNTLETQFFMELLALDRAGSVHLKNYHREIIENLRTQWSLVKNRVQSKEVFSDIDKLKFYSDNLFSKIRISCGLNDIKTLEDISKLHGLSPSKLQPYVDFLLEKKLIRINDNSELELGIQNTHLDTSSPLIKTHHKNWRMEAIMQHPAMNEKDLAFSSCFSISESDKDFFRNELLELIEKLSIRVKSSNPEKMTLFNLDFIELNK